LSTRHRGPARAEGEVIHALLAVLDALLQEHRRCGELDGAVVGERVWMACECGAAIAHRVEPAESGLED
jgi:hypothetical protein